MMYAVELNQLLRLEMVRFSRLIGFWGSFGGNFFGEFIG